MLTNPNLGLTNPLTHVNRVITAGSSKLTKKPHQNNVIDVALVFLP